MAFKGLLPSAAQVILLPLIVLLSLPVVPVVPVVVEKNMIPPVALSVEPVMVQFLIVLEVASL